jgi:hypothetical protein
MSHRKNLLLGIGVVLLTVLGSVSVADAQGYPPPYYPPPPPPPPRGVFRAGIVWGFALGLGDVNSANCPNGGSACGGAFAVEGHLGGMISPRTAVMFEAWGADHPYSFAGTDHETINSFWTGAAQFWLSDLFWIKGGAGLAVLRETTDCGYDYYGNTLVCGNDKTGFALFGAAGVEILQSYNFALDIQGRIGAGFYGDSGGTFNVENYAILVGFNWY